jgi:UDP-N-acetylmuramate--alanine ligase
MSALAQALLHAGWSVSGSDRSFDNGGSADVAAALLRCGVRVGRQDGRGVSPGSVVVVSSAIEEGNRDLAAAAGLGCRRLHRAEMLAILLDGKRCVAVTGTSGKSTVTGMIGVILETAGWDPTVVNGARVLNWQRDGALGNVRRGRSDWWVIEADESDRSLLSFKPEWAAITNISPDHFSMEETAALFAAFVAGVTGGVVGAVGGTDPYAGFSPFLDGDGSSFEEGGEQYAVHVPGRHNAENALIAVRLCLGLGCRPEQIRAGLAEFRGIHRRLEHIGSAGGIEVFDDYAHNPAKIRAAWETVAVGAKRVLAIWRPHGYGPLAKMKKDLAVVFETVCRADDRLWILPVYDAGGTADRSTGPESLLAEIGGCAGRRASAASVAGAIDSVSREARDGDSVLVMGARDPELPAMARLILKEVARRRGATVL